MNSAVVRSIEPADSGDSSDVIGRLQHVGRAAREASAAMSAAGSRSKDDALQTIANLLRDQHRQIIEANGLDLQRARTSGVQPAFLDRLALDAGAIEQMAVGVEQVTQLTDPIGEIVELKPRPSGIKVGRMRVPLGVIAIIYESRPNVTVDAAALCIKSGNSAILRGGSEAIESNRVLARIVREGLVGCRFARRRSAAGRHDRPRSGRSARTDDRVRRSAGAARWAWIDREADA